MRRDPFVVPEEIHSLILRFAKSIASLEDVIHVLISRSEQALHLCLLSRATNWRIVPESYLLEGMGRRS